MDMTQKGLDREANRAQATPLVPAVDIWEDESGIHLEADMPGVAKDSLVINVDGETLVIEGTVTLGESTKMDDVYAEVRVAQYRRGFVLGRDLDRERIEARLANGVLSLRIPKLEAAKPRRVEVKPA